MRITRKIATAGLVGALGLTGAAVVASPVMAAGGEVPAAVGQVAPEGRQGSGAGPGLEAAATVLGMSADELRTALQADGVTLADVAAEQGVGTDELVDALVDAATERLAARVEEGRLTQAEADERLAGIRERVAERVTSEDPGPGDGARRGAPDHDGPGRFGPDGDGAARGHGGFGGPQRGARG